MKLSGYIYGFIGLTKDAARFIIYLLKRPHYVAFLLAAIIGIFYLNGVPPQKIAVVVQSKWAAFVANRKETFKEDLELISAHFSDKKENKTGRKVPEKKSDAASEKGQTAPDYRKQMEEENFGWKPMLQAADSKSVPDDENAVQGILSVVSADKVRIEEHVFLLKIKLHAGQAGEAYQQVKRRFDGRQAKCIPDKETQRAECFVGALGMSEMLIDFGLADPI